MSNKRAPASDARVEARVLRSLPLGGKTYPPGALLILPAALAKSLQGDDSVDPHPEAVAYAKSQGVAPVEPDFAELDPKSLARAGLDAALAKLPDGNTDPDYVVRAMRDFFRDVFTDDDEKRIRELVKKPE